MPRELKFRKNTGWVFQKSVCVTPRKTEISEKFQDEFSRICQGLTGWPKMFENFENFQLPKKVFKEISLSSAILVIVIADRIISKLVVGHMTTCVRIYDFEDGQRKMFD